MKVKCLISTILVLTLILLATSSAEAASLPSLMSTTFLSNAAETAVANLWDSSRGAFKASPLTEPYNYWVDDQGKMLELLAASPSHWSYASAVRSFISNHITSSGSAIRRDAIQQPTIESPNPLSFVVQNRLIEAYGDLSKAKDRSFKILYLPQGTLMSVIQGHVVWNGTADLDLSYVYSPTAYSITSGTSGGLEYARLTQIWDLTGFKMTIDYTFWEHRAYLEVGYSFYAKAAMSAVKVVVPLDQLDWFGSTMFTGGPHLGYQWVWIPGYADQKSNDTPNQHFLPNTSQWNATWFMVHMHDKPDGVSSSLAIVADWGVNKTVLGAVDNALTGSELPPLRNSPSLHWLKQYAFLGAMTLGQTKTFSLKYYFLDAHDWTNLSPTYSEIFNSWNLADKDPSQNYQYGALVYGLAKMYQATGDSSYVTLAVKTWANWDRMFRSAGTYPHVAGTYLQSLPFMLRGELLLYSLSSDPGFQAQMNQAIQRALDKLLETQQLNGAMPNYGGFQEWRWYNETSGFQYWGNSYLDFTAPAIRALVDYYNARGNSTVLDRITTATNHFKVADGTSNYQYVEWDPITQSERYHIIPAGIIVGGQNTTATIYDWAWPSYKSAMIAQAYSSTLDNLGYNQPIAMRAISQLWWKATLNSTRTVIYVDSSKYETNSETEPWGAIAWKEWMDAATALTGSAQLAPAAIFSSLLVNMTAISWSSNILSIEMSVASGETIKVSAASGKEISGVYVAGASSYSYTWDSSRNVADVSIEVPTPGTYTLQIYYPTEYDFHVDYPYFEINWTGTGGTKNFTGFMVANERLGIVNSSRTGFSVGWTYPCWWIFVNDTASGENEIWVVYNKPVGWILSNSPMPRSIYGEQTLMGNFTLSGDLHVKADSGVFNYGPRMAQINGLTAPYGNGTWSSYRYELTVKPIPGHTYGQIYVTWEQAGPGTATIIVIAVVAVAAGGVIYVARKRIQK